MLERYVLCGCWDARTGQEDRKRWAAPTEQRQLRWPFLVTEDDVVDETEHGFAGG